MKSLKISCFILFFCFSFNFVLSQYQLSVPFNNGFVGNNTANNKSTVSYYTVALGWSNLQFTQNSTATVFTEQGNDIAGSVLITDVNGIEYTINGFVKWRAPSGSVTTICFQPNAGTNVTLATNGTNGPATYTINDTK